MFFDVFPPGQDISLPEKQRDEMLRQLANIANEAVPHARMAPRQANEAIPHARSAPRQAGAPDIYYFFIVFSIHTNILRYIYVQENLGFWWKVEKIKLLRFLVIIHIQGNSQKGFG